QVHEFSGNACDYDVVPLPERWVRLSKKFPLLAATLLLTALCLGQTLKTLTHQPPAGVGMSFLLTDGSVLFQGNAESTWYKLTPDISGSYLNGTWKQVATLPAGYVPDAFASAVLADGRVIVEGGEYNNGAFTLTNKGAIYDPKANTWTPVAPPT